MLVLRKEFPKLDMPEGLIRQFARPPKAPEDCVFALTTQTISADLKTKIVPCQFGGNPDCGSCGCVASMGLAAVAAHKLGGFVPVGAIFKTSLKIGQARNPRRHRRSSKTHCGCWGRRDDHERTYPRFNHVQLARLRQLTARIGADPLLTQASTGNSSIKLGGVLWIKASGKWMVDAMRDDIFLPLDSDRCHGECLRRGLDPSRRYPGASVETAMHAALPHRVVLHVHSVNTIAWAIRQDAAVQLRHLLDGLHWQWIPYVASGLPLARGDRAGAPRQPGHRCVCVGQSWPGDRRANCERRRRPAARGGTDGWPFVRGRAHPADYSALEEFCHGASWDFRMTIKSTLLAPIQSAGPYSPAACSIHVRRSFPATRT